MSQFGNEEFLEGESQKPEEETCCLVTGLLRIRRDQTDFSGIYSEPYRKYYASWQIEAREFPQCKFYQTNAAAFELQSELRFNPELTSVKINQVTHKLKPQINTLKTSGFSRKFSADFRQKFFGQKEQLGRFVLSSGQRSIIMQRIHQQAESPSPDGVFSMCWISLCDFLSAEKSRRSHSARPIHYCVRLTKLPRRSPVCRGLWGLLVVLLATVLTEVPCRADRFVVVDEQGDRREIVGRLHGSAQGAYAIEKPNGQIELIAQGAVLERDNTVEWKALSPAEMAEELSAEFGKETFRHHIEGKIIVGMILMDSIPRNAETRVTTFLRKGAKFMNNVQTMFLKFAKDLKLSVREPEVPLVLLIFESDEDFNRYTNKITGGQGLAASNILGFYNGLTNYLAIRMSECNTFEVPLHEAIHQQVYNRGIFQRLAPIPSWFNEGIATGFEGNGDRINSGPTRIHPRYSEQYFNAAQVTWGQMITDDQVFRGDVLAGDAYCHAWALHWLLVTKREQDYARYVKMLSKKEPLAKDDAETRKREFEAHFGTDMQQLQAEFVQTLQRMLRVQKNVARETSRPGYLRVQKSLADLEITAVSRLDRGGALEVEGKLKNINPFRNLTYCVIVQTESGSGVQWLLPAVGSNKLVTLPVKSAAHQGTGGSQAFQVHVFSTLPGGPEAERWQRGELPALSP